MKHEILNEIIKIKGYKKYLEIGIDDPDSCFNLIDAEKKIGVDPYNDKLGTHQWTKDNVEKLKEKIDGEWYEMTSDEFFKKKRNKFDLIFIDGLHLEEQVDKDIENSLSRLNKGGMIVLHDTIPKSDYEQTPNPEYGQPWTGTVYRSFWKLRSTRDDLELYTIPDNTGFSFIRQGKNEIYPFDIHAMSYEYFNLYSHKIMNVITREQLYGIIAS